MLDMMVNGSLEVRLDKERVSKFGQMVQCMKVGGKTIKPTELVDLFMLMVMFMMGNG